MCLCTNGWVSICVCELKNSVFSELTKRPDTQSGMKMERLVFPSERWELGVFVDIDRVPFLFVDLLKVGILAEGF